MNGVIGRVNEKSPGDYIDFENLSNVFDAGMIRETSNGFSYSFLNAGYIREVKTSFITGESTRGSKYQISLDTKRGEFGFATDGKVHELNAAQGPLGASINSEGTIGVTATVPVSKNTKVGVYADNNLFDVIFRTLLGVDKALTEAIYTEAFTKGVAKCFAQGTPIPLSSEKSSSIEFIETGDLVLSFDANIDEGYATLVPKRVLRTFTNITDEWLRLTWVEDGEAKELVTTPGHHFLAAQGGFHEIESLVSGGHGTVVLANGSEAEVTSERIVYSAATADMFEQAEGYVYPENGNLALKPVYKKGWKTYNFEVEDFHTYVAGGVRVHNDSWSDNAGFEYANWQSRDGNATVELSDGTRAPLNGEDVLYDRLSMPASYRDTPEAHADSLAFGMGKAGFSFKDVSYATWREHTLHRQTPEQRAKGLLPEAVSDPKAFSRREAHNIYKDKQGEKAAAPGSNQNSGRNSEGSTVDTTRSRETGIGSGGLGDYDNDGEVSAREHNRAEAEGKYDSDGESGGNGGGGKPPIIFDLDDDGIEVTALDRSTIFMDTAGDGFLRRTAWAGEGDGVLYFDPDGRNEITEKRQFIFTEWDPTATNDLEALASVFDSNGDGVLNASDADFSKFKLMVTNADGSIVSKTLAELGITELDLTADATHIELSDGSVITGQTTFKRSDGTTGTVGDMLLASEAQGHRVEQVETTDGSGNRVLTSTAYAADGSKAYEIHSVVSPDGLNITNRYDDNGDGVTDRIQTIVTVVNPDGSRTETETNLNGSVTATAVLEIRIVTTTSADGKVETIERDLMGGGWYDQREVRTEHADGSRTIVLSDLAQNGSVITSRSETVTIDGLVRTDGTDRDGDGLADTTVTHTVTVHADDSRTETVATANRDGSLRAHVQEDVSADGRTKTILRDLDGDGDTDTREDLAITVAPDGVSTSVLTVKNGDGSVRSSSTTVQSDDALTRTTELDQDGDGDIDVKTVEETVVNADDSRETTVTVTNTDGSVRAKTKETLGADKVSSTTWADLNQNGIFESTDLVSSVAVSAATQERIATRYARNADGSVNAVATSTTSSDGLTKTIATDADADGDTDLSVSDVTVLNGDSSSKRTVTTSNQDASLRTLSETVTSADGLTTTVRTDVDGDGAYEEKSFDTRVLETDGGTTRTSSNYAGNETTLLARTVVHDSADRRVRTITFDRDGDGNTDNLSVRSEGTDGATTLTETVTANDGTVLGRSVTSTSANGLVSETATDLDGDLAADVTAKSTTVLNADGSQATTQESRNADLSLRIASSLSISDDGLVTVRGSDRDGDGTEERVVTETRVLEADGDTVTTIEYRSADGSLLSESNSTTLAHGRYSITRTDADGDGAYDLLETTSTTLYSSGTVSTRTDVKDDTGVLRSRERHSISDDGRNEFNDIDLNGDGNYDIKTSRKIASSGITTVHETNLAADGSLQSQTRSVTSADGLVTTTEADRHGDGTYETAAVTTRVLNADGSVTETSELKGSDGTLWSRSVATTGDDGLSSSLADDMDADGQVDRTTSRQTVIAQDGTVTTTTDVTAQNGALIEKSVESASGDGRTTSMHVDRDGDGQNDEEMVTSVGDDGVTTTTSSYFAGDGALLARMVTTESGNGLSRTQSFDLDGDGTDDRTLAATTVLGSDGSRTSTIEHRDGLGALLAKEQLVTSDDGLATTLSQDLDGDNTFETVTSSTTTFAANGETQENRETRDSANALTATQTRTTSGNGLQVTQSTDFDGDGNADRVNSLQLGASGGSTETESFYGTGTTLLRGSSTTVSADGRTVTSSVDRDGDGANDLEMVTAVDFSRNETVTYTDKAADGSTEAVITKTTSANGATQSYAFDIDGDGTADTTRITTMSHDGAGNEIGTFEERNAAGQLEFSSTTTTSANGLTSETVVDSDGDGEADNTEQTVTTLNADGSTTTASTDWFDTGVMRSSFEETVSTDGRTVSREYDFDGDTITDKTFLSVTGADGSVTVTETAIGDDDAATRSAVTTTSSDGLKTTVLRDGITQTISRSPTENGSYSWDNGVTDTSGRPHVLVTHSVDGLGLETWEMRETMGGGAATVFTQTFDADAKARLLVEAARIYDAVLDRDMDLSEVEVLVRYGSNGQLDRVALSEALLSSVEYQTRYGSLSDTGFVARLYHNTLGREPFLDELEDHLGALSGATATRAEIAAELAESAEHLVVGNGHTETNNHDVFLMDLEKEDPLEVSFDGGPVEIETNDAKVLIGTATGETLNGTGYDAIYGRDGDDTLNGGVDATALIGGGGNDTLKGNTGDDSLAGGTGDDRLEGGTGDDTYSYERGDGDDVIADTGNGPNGDTLVFGRGIGISDLSFALSGANLIISFHTEGTAEAAAAAAAGLAHLTGSITIEGWTTSTKRIERIAFDDGDSHWIGHLTAFNGDASGAGTLTGGSANEWLAGLDGDDTLNGGTGHDLINGGAGNDVLDGQGGNDTLLGGAGNDDLRGGLGHDVLDAGAGDAASGWQLLAGALGNDQYLIGRDHERVSVAEHDGDGFDTVSFEDLSFKDISLSTYDYSTDTNNPLGVTSETEPDALVLSWDDGSATGEVWLNDSGSQIEKYEFADGSTVSSFSMGEDGRLEITGAQRYLEYLTVVNGSFEALNLSDGQAFYNNFYGWYNSSSNNGVFDPSAGSLTDVPDGENIGFVNHSNRYIRQDTPHSVEAGATYTFSADHVVRIDDGPAPLRLKIQVGGVVVADEIFQPGARNTSTRVGVSFNADDYPQLIGQAIQIVVQFGSSGGGAAVCFDDIKLSKASGGAVINGTDASEILLGSGGRDFLYAGGGDDEVHYKTGDRFWLNGVARDVGGDGTDTLVVETGSGFVTDNMSGLGFEIFKGADLNDRVTGDLDTVDYYLDGGAGNDTLTGSGGSDTLIGGDGNDSLDAGAGVEGEEQTADGGAGNDIYVIGPDTSHLWIIEDADTALGGNDTLQFIDITPDQLVIETINDPVKGIASQISWGEAASSKWVRFTGSSVPVEQFRFTTTEALISEPHSVRDLATNAIEKVGGHTTQYDRGTHSEEGFVGAGKLDTTVDATNKNVILGLSMDPGDTNYTSVDYGIVQTWQGVFWVYEAGVSKGNFGNYHIGDELSIERLADGTVQYLRNGEVFYTSAILSDISTTLYADASFYHHGSRLGDTYLQSGSGSKDLVTWIGNADLSVAGKAGAVIHTCEDLNGDGVVDAILTSNDGSIWTRLGDGQGGFEPAEVTGNHLTENSIVKTGGVHGSWDQGANSYEGLVGVGMFTTIVDRTDLNTIVGVSADFAGASFATIDYALFQRHDGLLGVYENGVSRGVFGAYNVGDELQIERLADGTVRYLKNSEVFYTSSVLSDTTTELFADSSFFHHGSSLGNTFIQSGSAPAELVKWQPGSGVSELVQDDTVAINYLDLNGDDVTDAVMTSEDGSIWTRIGDGKGGFGEARAQGRDLAGNGLVKTGGVHGSFDEGAFSKEGFVGAGALTTIVSRDDLNKAIGLSVHDTDTRHDSIDYALYQRNDGQLQVLENGVSKGIYGTYHVGDELQIERLADGTVQYLKNGVVFYTSLVLSDVATELHGDVGLQHHGSSVGDTYIQSGSAAAELVTWQRGSGVSQTGADSAISTSFKDLNGDGNVDAVLSSDDGSIWTRLGDGVGGFSEAKAQGRDLATNVIQKSGGGATTWDRGAYSQEGLAGAGTLTTTANQTNKAIVIGLSADVAGSSHFTSIEYGIFMRENADLGVYELGVLKGYFGKYAAGDQLSVERLSDGTVQYLKNGSVFYTSTVSSDMSSTLYVDASFYNLGGRTGETFLRSEGGPLTPVSWVVDPGIEAIFTTDPVSVTYEDLNGDNIVDAVLTSDDGSIWTRLGDGSGGFEKTVSQGRDVGTNSIEKVGGSTAGWDYGAYSAESFSGAGALSTVVAQTHKGFMVGLSTQPFDQGLQSIKFGINARSDNLLGVFETGVSKGVFGSYAIGDELSIERLADGTVQYLKNGVVFYTSLGSSDPSVALRADASFYHHGARLADTSLKEGNGPAKLVTWSHNQANIVEIFPDIEVDTSFQDSNGDNIVDAVLTSDDGSIWTRLGDGQGGFGEARAQGRDFATNSIEKIGGSTANWDRGAYSKEGLSGAGKLTTVVEQTNKYTFLGLSSDAGDSGYTSIDYAIDQSHGTIYVFENGINRGSFGSYLVGDLLTIERQVDGTVRYLKNDVVFYTSTVVSNTSEALHADASFYNHGSRLGETHLESIDGTVTHVNWTYDSDVALVEPDGPITTTFEDLNGDGVVDAVLTSTDGSIWTRLGDGHGGFGEAKVQGRDFATNAIEKTGGSAGLWDRGAYSEEKLTGAGVFTTMVAQRGLQTGFGVSVDAANSDFNVIDYAISFRTDSRLQVVENGVSKGIFNTFSVGDEISIERLEDGKVQYLHNGAVFYTSAVVSVLSESLRADASFFHHSSRLGDTFIQSGGAARDLVTWVTDPGLVIAGPVGTVSTVYQNLNGDGIVDAVLTSADGSIWTRLGDGQGGFGEARAQGRDFATNSIEKIGGSTANWDRGAYSKEGLSGAGKLTTVVEQTNKYTFLGLSSDAGDSGYTSIDYAIDQSHGTIYVFENGINRGSFGSYLVGDLLTIERQVDGTVRYLKNDVVFYTSTVVSNTSEALHADASFYNHGSRLGETHLESIDGTVTHVNWTYDSDVALVEPDGPITTTFEDLNGDGVVDAILTADDGSIWTRLGDGQGGFGEANQLNGQQDDQTFNFVNGTAGNDTLSGSTGAEILAGGAGHDNLNGAGGSDILSGGTGSDTFVFTSVGETNAVVTDFDTSGASTDVLQFESSVFADWNAVLTAASDDGADTTIVLDADSHVVLKSVLLSSLQSDDFVFV